MTETKAVITSPLANVKVGDFVWLGSQPLGRLFKRQNLDEVVAVTPTGFRVKRHPKDLYKKANGKSWGGSTYRYYAIATPVEVAEWRAVKEQERQGQEATQRARNTAEAKRQELSSLFPQSTEPNRGVRVSDAEWGDRNFRAGRYTVAFHGLTESEVRQMAAALAQADGPMPHVHTVRPPGTCCTVCFAETRTDEQIAADDAAIAQSWELRQADGSSEAGQAEQLFDPRFPHDAGD